MYLAKFIGVSSLLISLSNMSYAELKISEVLYDAPNNDSTEEFIELYNPSCDNINLSGYSLADNSGNYNLSGSIAGNSYITIAKNRSAIQQLFGITPSLTSLNLALGNGGDQVILKKNGSNVDFVAWENYSQGWSLNAVNRSIFRTNNNDTNSQSDWANSTTIGTPNTGPLTSNCNNNGGSGDSSLSNGESILLSGATGERLDFTATLPAGSSNLVINLSGGTGDADLYVRFASAPTTSTFNCRPYLIGNNETCSFNTTQTGTYFIAVIGYNAFSNTTLSVNYNTANTGGGNNGGGFSEGANTNLEVYYATADGLTGNGLKNALNSIITDHARMSYSQVWEALSYTDQDPNNSNNVILLYSGRSQDKDFRSGQSNSPDAWNREHVWPKSHGFPSSGQHAYTDIHHLRPTDASINSSRGNKDFDIGGNAISEAPGNKTDNDSFEPRDAVKGDVARMIFYMDVRYQGNDSSGTPDLSIVNYTSTGTSQPLLGKLCTLLQWHQQDPVDNQEIRRNNRIFERQGNRNPFIDNPSYANQLYDNNCN